MSDTDDRYLEDRQTILRRLADAIQSLPLQSDESFTADRKAVLRDGSTLATVAVG